MDLQVVLCTVPDADTGAGMAGKLVEEGLAACVNLIPAVRSIYRWEGRVEDDAEALLVIKARASAFEPLRARLVELHPYDVPEVIALEVAACHEAYLAWLLESTGAGLQ